MPVESVAMAGFSGLRGRPETRTNRAPVVFLHGANSDHREFTAWLEWFARAGFESYAMPRRGRNGMPPPDASGLRFRDYLDDTRRVLAALDQPAIVIGHSLGGLLAQKVAEEGRCHAAVLVAPIAPREALTPRARLQLPPAALPFWLKSFPAAITGGRWMLQYSDVEPVLFNRVPPADRRPLFGAFVPESGIVLRETLAGVPIDARSVRCPVLCLSGRDDAAVPVSLVRSVARRYGAEMREYEGRGHLLMREPGWENVADDVLRWLSALPAA